MIANPPIPNNRATKRALRALLQQRNILNALESLHEEMGDVFRIPIPGFNPVVLVGPEANRFVFVTAKDKLRWRSEHDPVTRLLRHGVLVEDGDRHDELRRHMNPFFNPRRMASYVEAMWQCADQVMERWTGEAPRDMLVDMRRAALLILMRALFEVDFRPDLDRLWSPIMRTLAYISPGVWLIWRNIPQPGYSRPLKQLDSYLYQVIRTRRADPGHADDLLSSFIARPDMSEALIRDQLLTLLIAGHDTSTALLAWALYLLGSHPLAMQRLRTEIDSVLGDKPPTFEQLERLTFTGQVINEALRLYPPIHLGTRMAASDLEFRGYAIPAGTRLLYSIYLTHRHKHYWPHPERFDPDRFAPEQDRARAPYTFVPFGGGQRNCIGFAFARIEAKVVLARIFQRFDLRLAPAKVYPHMGATLEPRPGVFMFAHRRDDDPASTVHHP